MTVTTTVITTQVAIVAAGQTLLSPTLTVHDRNGDVDATLPPITVSGLPSGQWRLTVQIDSTPAIGKGPAQVYQATSAANATTVTAAQPMAYVRAKDVEHAAAGTLTCYIRLDRLSGSVYVPYGQGIAVVNYAAPPARKSTIRLGLNTHLFSAEAPAEFWRPALDALVDVGATWTRTSFGWGLIETSRGVRDANAVAQMDAFMTDCGTRGIKVCVLTSVAPTWSKAGGVGTAFSYTPRWWPGVPGYAQVFPSWSLNNNYLGGYDAPDSWADYTNYLNWLLGRYAGGGLAGAGGTALAAVETTNEPYVQTAFIRDGGSGGSMAGLPLTTFCTWQQQTYNAVKAFNAAIPCVAMSSAYCDWKLLQSLYDTGQWKGYYDAIAVHPYPVTFKAPLGTKARDPRFPIGDASGEWHHHLASIGYFIDVMDANNDPAEVWVTEFGQSSGDTAKTQLVVSPQEQADHVAYMWNLLSRYPRVGALFMHSVEDKGRNYYGESKDVFDNFGIVRTDHVTRKPSYQAVKTAIAAIKAGAA